MKNELKDYIILKYISMMYSEFLNGWTLNLDKIPKYEEFSETFTERLDMRVIRLLLKSNDYHACVKQNFKNHILPHIQDDGTYSHKYYQTGKIKIGRYYASTITDYPRKFKHTLFHHLGYVDIDQVKGHPSIIVWIAKTNNIEFPSIQKYINNPNSIFAKMREFYGEDLQQHQMKWVFNMMIYGGTPEKWVKDLINPPKKDRNEGWLPTQLNTNEIMPFIREFKSDCDELKTIIYKYNPDLVSKLTSDLKTEFHKKNRVISYFLQVFENHSMYYCYKYLCEHGFIKDNICCLEKDGICFPPAKTLNYDDEIDKINDYVIQQTGIKVKYAFKAYDEENIDRNLLENLDRDVKESGDIDHEIEYSHYGVASYILKHQKDYWRYCNGVLYSFDVETGLWSSCKALGKKIMLRCREDLFPMEPDRETKKKVRSKTSYLDKLQNLNATLEIMASVCESNDHWLSSVENTGLGKLLFKNGVYDFHKGKFFNKKQNPFNPNVYFPCAIPYDFPDWEEMNEEERIERNEEVDDLEKRMFVQALGKEVGYFQLYNYARGIAGDYMKRFVLNIGKSNCGKSCQTIAFKQTFGEYIGNWNGQSICVHKIENPDEAQSLRWVLVNRWKRIVFSNEIKASSIINPNMIKKLASSDSITARNHGQAEVDFTPHFLPVLYGNDCPSIDGADDAVLNRVKMFPFEKIYVDNPETENELKIDHAFEGEMKTLHFKQNFVLLMAKHYNLFVQSGGDDYEEPEACQIIKDDYIGNGDNDVINTFLNDFEFSRIDNDYTTNKEIKNWMKYEKLKMSITKLANIVKDWIILRNQKYNEKKEITQREADEQGINGDFVSFQLNSKFEYILETKAKKVDNKTQRVWLNIKYTGGSYKLEEKK